MRSALHTTLPSWRISALVIAKPDPSCLIDALTDSFCPGDTKERSLASFTAAKNGMRVNLVSPMISQPEAWFIVSISSTPGISG